MLDVHARLDPQARDHAPARPRARGAARRGGDRGAQARAPRPDAPRARRAAGLQQDRPLRRAARLERAGGPLPVGGARAVLPRRRCASASATAWPSTGCGARSSPRRWPTTSCMAAAPRSRSASPRRPTRRRPTSRAPTRWRARSSRCARLWGEIEALDNTVDAEVQTRMLLEGRRLIERGTRWLLRNRTRPLDIASTVECFAAGRRRPCSSPCRSCSCRPTSSRSCSRPRRSSRSAGVPPRLAHAGGEPARRWLGRLRHRGRRRRARSSRWRPWRPCTSGSAAAWSCTGCATASWTCRARTAGRRSPARRCATTSTGCTARSPPRCCAARASTTPTRSSRLGAGQPGAERTLETLADIRVGHNYDLTTLPVAVREVRNLLNAPD